ncbi:MAG: hypothetical protein J5J06_14435 [Phycisphaerae bacterium]|nr:hypothetical protein [Phycisphaerae bacterium]
MRLFSYRKTWVVTACACLLGLAAGQALAESVTIERKFKPGAKHYVEESADITQKMPGGPAGPVETTMTQVVGMWEEVKKGEGDAVSVVMTFDRFSQKVNTPFMGTLAYDTDAPDAADASPMLKPVFDALMGQSFTLKVGPKDAIEGISGVDELQSDVSEKAGNSMVWAQIKQQFNADSLRQKWGESAMAMYPNRKIDVGETWTSKTREPYQFGTMITDYTFKLEKVTEREGNKVAVVTFTGKHSLEAPAEPPPGQVTPELSGESTGKAFYDIDAGLFVENESTANMEFLIGRPGMEEKSKMEAVAKSTLRYLSPSEREKQEKEASAKAKSNQEKKSEESKEKND